MNKTKFSSIANSTITEQKKTIELLSLAIDTHLEAIEKLKTEYIPVKSIEDLIKTKSYIVTFTSDGCIDVSDLEQLIKEMKE